MNVLIEADRERLLERLRVLRPDARPVAGTLTAPRMVCHIADQIAVALGDIPSARQDTLMARTLGKAFALYAPIPIPFGRVKTVPEMLTSAPTDWNGDIARVASLLTRVADTDRFASHPAFGRLTRRQWGRLTANHLDHHLRQFGV